MKRQIVSANYFDRKSKDKWLIRQENKGTDKAKAYPAVKATNVSFEESGEVESGFGCGVIAKCDTAEGYSTTMPSFKKEGLTKLLFDFNRFVAENTGKAVAKVKTLYLTPEGEIFAEMAPTGKSSQTPQVKENAEVA